jgi:pilus assembly protein Flp/PilA
MRQAIWFLWADQSGADATEYALLAALIGLAIVGGATSLGINLNNALQSLAGTVPAYPDS